jgi:phosphotransferase family enzyme
VAAAHGGDGGGGRAGVRVIGRLEQIVGSPVELEELAHRPGDHRTLRASGSVMTAIVKIYASDRSARVAARVGALGSVPPGVTVPRVLSSDPELQMVVLTEVHGEPLTSALLERDAAACRCAGAAVGNWHRSWRGRSPSPLRPHSVARELKTLHQCADAAAPGLADTVRREAGGLGERWTCSTVVHRNLTDARILIGERVGLIGLDDAALGPPELDVGNLLAHIDLLSLRSGRDLAEMREEIVLGYEGFGEYLDEELLDRCRRLARLRLACIHDVPALTNRPNHQSRPASVRG